MREVLIGKGTTSALYCKRRRDLIFFNYSFFFLGGDIDKVIYIFFFASIINFDKCKISMDFRNTDFMGLRMAHCQVSTKKVLAVDTRHNHINTPAWEWVTVRYSYLMMIGGGISFSCCTDCFSKFYQTMFWVEDWLVFVVCRKAVLGKACGGNMGGLTLMMGIVYSPIKQRRASRTSQKRCCGALTSLKD